MDANVNNIHLTLETLSNELQRQLKDGKLKIVSDRSRIEDIIHGLKLLLVAVDYWGL